MKNREKGRECKHGIDYRYATTFVKGDGEYWYSRCESCGQEFLEKKKPPVIIGIQKVVNKEDK